MSSGHRFELPIRESPAPGSPARPDIRAQKAGGMSPSVSVECRLRPFDRPTKSGKPEDRPDLRKAPVVYVNKATFDALERAYGGPAATLYVLVQRLQDADADMVSSAPSTPQRGGNGGGGARVVSQAPSAVTTTRPLCRYATVMPSSQELKGDVARMTRVFMEAVGFHTGDLVKITPNRVAGEKFADVVVVEDITKPASDDGIAPPVVALTGWERKMWELGIQDFLTKQAAYVFPRATFSLKVVTGTRLLRISSVNSQTDNLARTQSSTKVQLVDSSPGSDSEADPFRGRELVVTGIPGLASQIAALNEFLADLQSPPPALSALDARWRSCAIVIHGGRGTGKSFVLDKMAAAAEGSTLTVLRVDKAATLTAFRDTVAQAQTQQPSLVLIDDLDDILEAGQRSLPQVLGFLTASLDQFAEAAAQTGRAGVVLVATCKDYFTLPHELRRLRRFARNIALPIPDVPSKLEILKSFGVPLEPKTRDDVLLDVAKRTYAFNPEDLERLVAGAIDAGAQRFRREIKSGERDPESEFFCTTKDLENALARTTPSSLHDINLRPPTVHWKDIGGQQKVKNELQRMIREVLGQSPLCLQPPKGILMYGPPGCAKTYCAQALATESGFNFFSVKGPELLNQYVGETERAIRRLFQRAAASSPAIIFFDELDTMGMSPRKGGGNSKGGAGGVGVGVLGALLTELDGFEKLEDVVVLAATNSPESIEPALLRSGRLDRYLFVGPPNASEREEIFQIYANKVPFAADVDLAALAADAEGYTGADIRGVVNEAGHIVFTERTERGEDIEGAEIGKEHLQRAMEVRGPSVTSEILTRYTEWRPSQNFKS